VSGLVFRIHCPVEGPVENEIEAVAFSELTRQAEFQLREKNQAIHKYVPFAALPAMHRENLFP